MLALGVAAMVVVAALVLPGLVDGEESGSANDPRVPVRSDEAVPDGDTTLDDVRVSEPTPSHVSGDVDYPDSPATGGPHHDIWLDCGVYDAPVPQENVVHDLEHGTVWVAYRPDLDADDVAALADALPQNGILSPYDDLRAPVVVTVWGRQLDLTGADDPRLGLFIDEFAEGVTAPEPFASCAGGASLEELEQLTGAVVGSV